MRRRPIAIAIVLALAGTQAAAQPRRINISPYDYPPDVQPGERALTVTVGYQLGPDGRFTRCQIERSSGRPSIDAESCRLLERRARFRPERGRRRGTLQLEWLGASALERGNPRGAPIPVSLHDEISSNDYPGPALSRNEHGTVRYEVLVSATGLPVRCTIVDSSGSAALDRRTCEIVMQRSAFIPGMSAAGGSAPGIYRSRISWRLGDRDP